MTAATTVSGLSFRPSPLTDLEPWKAGAQRTLVQEVLDAAVVRLDGQRVILTSLDVHDVVRDVLIKVLSTLGAEVVLLPGDSHPAAAVHAAVQEDADVIIASTYNGAALRQANQLVQAARQFAFDGRIIMGGVLNEDLGEPVPTDVTERVRAVGIYVIDDLRRLPEVVQRLPGSA